MAFFVAFVSSMLRAAVKLPLNASSCSLPHAGRVTTRVNDPVLDFYPSARACARLPETVQSRSRTCVRRYPLRGGRPLARPVANRTRRARETRRREPYATVLIAPVGTTPCVIYRHSAITSLRATATMPIRRARFPFPNRA